MASTLSCLGCQERAPVDQFAPSIEYPEAVELPGHLPASTSVQLPDRFLDDLRLAMEGQISSLGCQLEEAMRRNTDQILKEFRSKPASNSEGRQWSDQGDEPKLSVFDESNNDMKGGGTAAYMEQLNHIEASTLEKDHIERGEEMDPAPRKSYSQEMEEKWRAMQLKQISAKFQLARGHDAVSFFMKPLQYLIEKHQLEEIPHNWLARFCEGRPFSTTLQMLIVGNTIFMGIEADMDMRVALGTAQSSGLIFPTINRCFAGVFFLELIIRISALRWYWLLAPDWRWNLFDAFLVASTIFQELVENANLSFMRIFRLCRVVRVAKVMRIVRFFRELRRMVIAISSCFASLCWAGLLLLLIMFIFSIVILQGASTFVREAADDEISTTAKEGIALWYATLGNTMFTLILAITGGLDWWEMLHPLLHVSEIYRYVFTFYVVFVVVGVLNVLTAVFLENATEVQDKDLLVQAQIMQNDAFCMEMRDFFHDHLDHQSSGFIEWERFQEVMHQEEIQAYLSSQLLESQDAYTLFHLIDRDNDGRIALEPFVQGCLHLRGNARAMDIAVLLREQAHVRTQLLQLRAWLTKLLPAEQVSHDSSSRQLP